MTKQSGLSEHKKPEICSWTASFFSRVSISNTFSQAESLPVSHHFHLQNWKLENDNSAHAEMVQSRLKAAGIAALLVLYPALCWSHCSALISHNSSFSSKKKRFFYIFSNIYTTYKLSAVIFNNFLLRTVRKAKVQG